MEIRFQDKKIQKICEHKIEAIKKHGKDIADTLFVRLAQITATSALDELRLLPGHFHSLTGDLAGKWACNLSRNWRLIFSPITEDELVIALIEQIQDYH